MRDEIETALVNAFNLPVYFGTDLEASGKRIYDYLVFWEEETDWKVGSKGDPTDHYGVIYVRQNQIPENEKFKVIDVLRKITGLKETGQIKYDYPTLPGTKLQLQTAEYHFIAAQKRLTIEKTGDEQSS